MDHQAKYEDLLRRYMAPLRRLAWSYTREGYEDLLQEIAMALWTALPRFRGDCSERTWIYRVAHNTAISFATSDHRRVKREHVGPPDHDPPAKADLEIDAIERQRRDRLQAAVRALPIADRQMVVLYLEGLSAAEIETVTGVTAGAVATRLSRARQKLTALVRGEEAPA